MPPHSGAEKSVQVVWLPARQTTAFILNLLKSAADRPLYRLECPLQKSPCLKMVSEHLSLGEDSARARSSSVAYAGNGL